MNINWKPLDKIDIVYSANDYTEFNGVKYPKAYIVENGNAKSMETALRWANGWYGNTAVNSKAKIVTTDNSDFDIQIAKAPGNSSQSGKLAFWMCIFSKNGIPSFSAGINSELLNILILQSTLVNGALTEEKVFFARSTGNLGVLHKNMAEYKNFCKDCKTRVDVSKRPKTKKWKTGYSYLTTRETAIMLGQVTRPFYCKDWTNNWILDFDAQPQDFWGRASDEPPQFDSVVHYALYSSDPCPARIEGEKIFDVTDDYELKLVDSIEKAFHSNCNSNGYHNFASALEEALIIYGFDPERAMTLLDELENALNAYVASRPSSNWGTKHYLSYKASKIEYPDRETMCLAAIGFIRNHHGGTKD